MTDRARWLLQTLGQGLWQKATPAESAITNSGPKLWAGVKPERLGTLGLLRELRDNATKDASLWNPHDPYNHLTGSQWDETLLNFDRLIDQLHPGQLTPEERATVLAYQQPAGNFQSHRQQAAPTKREQDLYDLLQVSELPLDLNVYRGFNIRSNSSSDRLPLRSPPSEGDVLGSRGFMSTSVDPSKGWDFLSGDQHETGYLADIYLPERTRALPVKTGHSYDTEREVLLSPGQRYRVASEPEPYSEDFGNSFRLRLEALHPDDPYQAPEELRHTYTTVPHPTEDPAVRENLSVADQLKLDELWRSRYQGQPAPPQPRGHYARDGVYGYLAGLGPLAALATPSIMDLYSQEQQ